jgi:hypothetical protein
VLITGIRSRTSNLNFGLVNYLIKDIMNPAYGEADYMMPFGGSGGAPGFRISVNDLDQRSVGADLIKDAPVRPIRPRCGSSRLSEFRAHCPHSQVGRGADIRDSFYGFKPSFTSMSISSFQRANEKGYLASLSYDFSALGLNGMKFYVGWGKGVDAVGAKTGDPLSDRDELDLRLAFEPNSGPSALCAEVEYIDEHYD